MLKFLCWLSDYFKNQNKIEIESDKELSLEEKYNKLLYEKTKEALENWEYTYDWTYVSFNNENIPKIFFEKWFRTWEDLRNIRNVLIKWEFCSVVYYEYIYNKDGDTRALCYHFFRDAYREAERITQEKIEAERQAELLEKYNKLLWIKPLDEDLKQAIKKSEKLLNIADNINKLRDEALRIKWEHYG